MPDEVLSELEDLATTVAFEVTGRGPGLNRLGEIGMATTLVCMFSASPSAVSHGVHTSVFCAPAVWFTLYES